MSKSDRIIEEAYRVLEENHPMTVRQIYYQLVSIHLIDNNRSQYQAVSTALVKARQNEDIPWEWVEDRLRRPRTVSMWSGLPSFSRTVEQAYRRDVWATQPGYAEFWVEKDALSGIFEDILEEYGYTLNVGRGYDGWSSIKNAADRFRYWKTFPKEDEQYQPVKGWDYDKGRGVEILYFGDFDPSGEDMVRSLEERLRFFDTEEMEMDLTITKCALTLQDVRDYNLPPDLTKASDSRRDAFVEKYGDISVELDALPIDVLRERIREEAETFLDMEAYRAIREVEASEIEKIKGWLQGGAV